MQVSLLAQLLEEQGAKIIGVSDSQGGVYNKNGIQVGSLRRHKEKKNSVVGFAGTKSMSNEDLLEQECTILIPAGSRKSNYQEECGKN